MDFRISIMPSGAPMERKSFVIQKLMQFILIRNAILICGRLMWARSKLNYFCIGMDTRLATHSSLLMGCQFYFLQTLRAEDFILNRSLLPPQRMEKDQRCSL